MLNAMKKRIGNKKGFTLIELIVVIAILGILALVAIPQITGIQERAREQADIANGRMLANQVAVLFAQGQIDAGTYSTVTPGAGADADLTTSLRGTWPTKQAAAAAAGNATGLIVTITDAGVVTVDAGGVEVFPTPEGDYAN